MSGADVCDVAKECERYIGHRLRRNGSMNNISFSPAPEGK